MRRSLKIYTLEFTDKGLSRLSTRDTLNPSEIKIYTPITVTKACKILGRSQRQIYRYMREGMLEPLAKVSGICFLDALQVRELARQLRRLKDLGDIPASFKPLFPEYSLKSLHPIRDRVLILGRILTRGNFQEIRWCLSLYAPDTVKAFLQAHGTRLLDGKSLCFWCWYFDIPTPVAESRRVMGRRLGGVG